MKYPIPNPITTRLLAILLAVALGQTSCSQRSQPAAESYSSVAPLALSKADRVARAKQLLAAGKQYPRGCSDFVCDVLQIPWRDADSLMGDSPKPAGTNNDYDDTVLVPGDVVGWNHADGPADSDGHGHVAIYLGKGNKQIIDVQRVNQSPREIHGYGAQTLYKSSNF